MQDAKLPSVATIVAGAPVKGSWWGHPKGRDIFRAAGALQGHDDVRAFKLVNAKVTFVHRRHFSAIVAVGSAREEWQLGTLSRAARALLCRVDAEHRVRAEGKDAKALERALLVSSEEVHTASGAHAVDLLSWRRFARETGVPPSRRSARGAKAELEESLRSLNVEFGGAGRLPWQQSAPVRRR